MVTAREEEGLHNTEEYIQRRQNTAAVQHYSTTARPVGGGGYGTKGAIGDAVVGSGKHQYGGGKESGGGGRGRGRGVTEGMKRKTSGTKHQNRIQVSKLTNQVKESSVSLVSVQGV